jgi:hypothetical protein
VWVAGFPGSARPRRRAATRDGFFPVNLEHPDELAAAIDGLDLPDIVVARPAGTDVTAFAAAGATWWLTDFDPEKITVVDKLEQGLDHALKTGEGPLYVVPTYTALLELREILTRRGQAEAYWR